MSWKSSISILISKWLHYLLLFNSKTNYVEIEVQFLISSQNTSDLKISMNIFISIQKNEYFYVSLFYNILSD